MGMVARDRKRDDERAGLRQIAQQPELPVGQQAARVYYSLMPNMMVSIHPDYANHRRSRRSPRTGGSSSRSRCFIPATKAIRLQSGRRRSNSRTLPTVRTGTSWNRASWGSLRAVISPDPTRRASPFRPRGTARYSRLLCPDPHPRCQPKGAKRLRDLRYPSR